MEKDKKYKYKHCFAISAYKESEFLEDCIRSLIMQTRKTNIIICTSTPNEHIRRLAEKYKLLVYERGGATDMRSNWNYAYNMADAKYVTVVHQDDMYGKRYAERLLDRIEQCEKNGRDDIIMCFTDYRPIRYGKPDKPDLNCKIRRILKLHLKNERLAGSEFAKRMCLSLGNSIICQSVAYNKQRIGDSVFTSDMRYDLDWDTFYKLSQYKGRFLYIDSPLVYYRIHEGALSEGFMESGERQKEDMEMFCKMWPHRIAKFIMRFYKQAYKNRG